MSGDRVQANRERRRKAQASSRGAKFAIDDRDPGLFVALPHAVLDCAAFIRLPHPARSLLLEVARQFNGHNNGQLLLSARHMETRGWLSADVIARHKAALIEAGFLHETVKGCRPNKASWYAVTWQNLRPNPKYDAGAAETFRRSAYKDMNVTMPKPTRQALFDKWRQTPEKNTSLIPPHGAAEPPVAPPGGAEGVSAVPRAGAIDRISVPASVPPSGDHIEVAISRRRLEAAAARTRFGMMLRRVPKDWVDLARCSMPRVREGCR